MHPTETRNEFLKAYKSYPSKPNVKLISELIGISRQVGADWHAEIVETGTLQHTTVTEIEIEEYYDAVWKRDKQETYLKLRSITDKAMDRIDGLVDDTPAITTDKNGDEIEVADVFNARDFSLAMKGVEIGVRTMHGLKGETMGKVEHLHQHAHAHAHQHAVVILPPIQSYDTIEDSEMAFEEYRRQVEVIDTEGDTGNGGDRDDR